MTIKIREGIFSLKIKYEIWENILNKYITEIRGVTSLICDLGIIKG